MGEDAGELYGVQGRVIMGERGERGERVRDGGRANGILDFRGAV